MINTRSNIMCIKYIFVKPFLRTIILGINISITEKSLVLIFNLVFHENYQLNNLY